MNVLGELQHRSSLGEIVGEDPGGDVRRRCSLGEVAGEEGPVGEERNLSNMALSMVEVAGDVGKSIGFVGVECRGWSEMDT